MRENRKKYFRPFDRVRGDLNVVVREGAWKGIWNAERERLELYDLAADLREERDRSGDDVARATRLRREAEAWLERCRRQGARAPPAPGPAPDAAGRARLRALGYVE
jgi:hypothetical protein